jgi:hypothetical protein
MSVKDELNNKNFLLYCAKHYDNPQCEDTEEFLEDLQRVKYIKKLITRYVESGDLKERLILNHLIILNNIFGPVHLSKILYLKCKDQMKYIKPFLILLSILPEILYNVNKEAVIFTDTIPMDENTINILRKV